MCSSASQQFAPWAAGLPLPQSSAARLPTPSSAPVPAQFAPGVSAGPPRGIAPPSMGQVHQVPPMPPGGGSQRPPGAVPLRPHGVQQPTATGPSVCIAWFHAAYFRP